MQSLVEYLENARKFEQLAAEEAIPQIKARFEVQAAYCRKRAEIQAAFLQALEFEDLPRGDDPGGVGYQCEVISPPAGTGGH